MSEPPRRRRFQIHLSTAMVLMFAAGGMIWANVSRQKVPLNASIADDINDFDARSFAEITSKTTALDVLWDEHYSVTSMGWPCRAATFNDFERVCTRRLNLTIAERTHRVDYTKLLMDIAVAIVVLIFVSAGCEWIARRRQMPERT